ncbi:hypothetical protein MJN54_36140, partial [Salmonella enterica subsp. enterica serovar Kentucky]|nr:hypothetical protein [Salmonella enterica subsp. enterica serovar Kentucky]
MLYLTVSPLPLEYVVLKRFSTAVPPKQWNPEKESGNTIDMTGTGAGTTNLNSDLRVRTSLLPENIEMLCTGGKLRGSQVT